jgi:SnoaL-like domain
MELDASAAARLSNLADQQEIRDAIYRYCRGIDRRDLALVRSCFHADATDDHGDFRGTVDEFVAYVERTLPRYERTMHFIGNVLVEVGHEALSDKARAESYVVAYHRQSATDTKPARDFVVNLRYVDDFERREGTWRIATRVCVVEFARLDTVLPGGWSPGTDTSQGQFGSGDAVFAASLRGWNPRL